MPLLKRFSILILFLIIFFTENVWGQLVFNPQKYVCYKTNQTLQIDGNLDEKNWKNAIWTNDFVDIEGDKKPKPLYQTRVKMLWDEQYLYIGAELEEPNLWATYTQRESVIFHENDFEVFIDPDGDTHNYYEYELNALGTDWDLMLTKPYRDQGNPINAWNINQLKKGIQLHGTLNKPQDKDSKWTIELAFPWEILKECASRGTKPQDKDQWRINFSRVEWRLSLKDGKYTKEIDAKTGKSYAEYNWVWSPQGVIAMHQPETWGFVQFSDKEVGNQMVHFEDNPDEIIKWKLRELYYLEHKFKAIHQKFTDNINLLNKNQQDIDLTFKPKIQLSQSRFEITAQGNQANEIWHIQEDGRVWKSIEN